MPNWMIVSDNQDESLGGFFKKCANKTEEIFQQSGINSEIIVVPENAAFDVIVPIQLDQINDRRFVFMSFTHGCKDSLLQHGETPFLATSDDVNHLNNSLAYCFACEAGEILGPEICENGTLAFIGYNQEVKIQVLFNAEDAFVDCAVSGLYTLFNGGTVGQVHQSMMEKHNECIDDFIAKDFFTASFFMENRDALVTHGNNELSIVDM